MKFRNEANAPPAIVGLVGRKEYEQCAKDLYYFLQVFGMYWMSNVNSFFLCWIWIDLFLIVWKCKLQSAVCTKLLALDLIELLLLTLFPELDSVFKQLHERKEKFGKLDAHV